MAARRLSRRDQRWLAGGLTAAIVLLGGWSISRFSMGVDSPGVERGAANSAAQPSEVQLRFNQAVVMLHARQYEHAATALHRVLSLSPQLPEAHANMGFALLGLKRHAEARLFFERSIALHPGQANAYYGLALCWEAAGDLAMAKGAMRSYLHLARGERPEHLSRARAALWEWQGGGEKAGAAIPAGEKRFPEAASQGPSR